MELHLTLRPRNISAESLVTIQAERLFVDTRNKVKHMRHPARISAAVPPIVTETVRGFLDKLKQLAM